MWRGTDGCSGYWSGRPGTVFEVPSELVSRYDTGRRTSLPLSDGGRTAGGRPLHAGDTAFGDRRRVATDGTSWWRLDEAGWREYDPATGSGGRRSIPAFFEDGLDRDGAELEWQASSLAVAPPELAGTPLGTTSELFGWRTVRHTDGSTVGVGVDGRTVTVPADPADRGRTRLPVAALTLPDGSQVGLLGTFGRISLWDGQAVTSACSTGDRHWGYAAGTPYVPPVDFWHALQPRDPRGSAALRAVTDRLGAALLASGPDGVGKVLPGLSHPALRKGVAGIVTIAQQCAATLQTLPEGRSCPPPADVQPVDDATLALSVSGMGTARGTFNGGYTVYGRGEGGATVLAAVRSACRAVLAAGGARRGLLSRLARATTASADGFVSTTAFWPALVGGLGALALRAALESTPPQERMALLALLETVAQTPLAEPDGRWRLVELVGTGNLSDYTAGTVVTTRTGAAVHLHVELRWNGEPRNVPVVWALEHSSSASFGAVGGLAVHSSLLHTGWGGRDRLLRLVALVRERGPVPWRPEAVAQLVEATGLTRAEAALLLAGLPSIDSYDHNFLPKQVRETLGLKVAEAGTARPGLARLTVEARRLLVGQLLPDDPAALWGRGPDVTALAETWVRSFGRRVAVPDELVGELTTAVKHRQHPAAELLQGLADPRSCSWLTQDKRFTVDTEGRLTASGSDGGFDGAALVAGTVGLLWLVHRLPQESPLRAALAQAYEALRARLVNPELLVSVLAGYDVSGFRQAWGHPPRATGSHVPEVLALGSTGVLVDREWGQELHLRPARLTGPQDPLLQAATGLYDPAAAALRLLAEPGTAGLVASLAAGGSGWPQDPLVSATDLVPQVADALRVHADAARLYLQLLAMPDPSDKHVARWNGWTGAQVKRAAAALLAAGAVVEGKRARAGRTVFLPGGWLDVKAPMPPVEAWKVPLLGLLPDGRHPLGVTVPTVPAGELFRAAWQRVADGDAPALEVLRTGRRR